MINLSFDELKLIAQNRNISDCESKSKEYLIKALIEPKPETQKPEIPKTETPEPEIPKPKPKLEIKVNKRKLKKLRKDFDELRHKFLKKKQIDIEKLFMLLKTKNIFLNQK